MTWAPSVCMTPPPDAINVSVNRDTRAMVTPADLQVLITTPVHSLIKLVLYQVAPISSEPFLTVCICQKLISGSYWPWKPTYIHHTCYVGGKSMLNNIVWERFPSSSISEAIKAVFNDCCSISEAIKAVFSSSRNVALFLQSFITWILTNAHKSKVVPGQ